MEISVESVGKAFSEYVEKNRRQDGPAQPHNYLYASGRRKCLRRSVYECTQPALMPEFPADVKARFLRGEQRENDIRIGMERAGQLSNPHFDFIGSQEAVKIHDRKGRLIISGKIDGKILWANRDIWPCEIKSWNSNTVDRLTTFEDVLNNTWTWSGAHQLLSYLYATSSPKGLLILDRSGLPKLIEIRLEEHLTEMEAFLKDAETVVDHCEAGTLPDFTTDAAECSRCWAKGLICDPPIGSGEGTQIFTDPEVEQKLLRLLELEPAGEEYEDLEKWFKASFRGVEIGLAGSVVINGKWRPGTKTQLPDEVKNQVDALTQPFKVKIDKYAWLVKATKV